MNHCRAESAETPRLPKVGREVRRFSSTFSGVRFVATAGHSAGMAKHDAAFIRRKISLKNVVKGRDRWLKASR